MAVDVPFDSKAIAPPKVAIDGPFHQDPAPVNVELVNENFPEPTISINPPANVNFEPVAVNVDESTLRSLSLLTIAPPLIPYASPKLLMSNLVFLTVAVAWRIAMAPPVLNDFATLNVESDTSNFVPLSTNNAPPSLASSFTANAWFPEKVVSEIFTLESLVAWIPPPLPCPSTKVLFKTSDLFSNVSSALYAYIPPPSGRTSSGVPAFFTAFESWTEVLSSFNLESLINTPPPWLWLPVLPLWIVDFVSVTSALLLIASGLPISPPSNVTLSNVTLPPFTETISMLGVTNFKLYPLPWIFPLKALEIFIVFLIFILLLNTIFCALLLILSFNSCSELIFPCKPVSALTFDAIAIVLFKIAGWVKAKPTDNGTTPIASFLIGNFIFFMFFFIIY